MEEVKPFGGFGNFRPPAAAPEGGLAVGEAGGFQDLLFGFGIYMAIATGHLAARSLLERRSFEELWRVELAAYLRASLSNRLLFELLGSLGHRYMIRRARQIGPQEFLRRWYSFDALRGLTYPLARRWFDRRFPGEKHRVSDAHLHLGAGRASR
jgi:flavin-dependent dehydrogenase